MDHSEKVSELRIALLRVLPFAEAIAVHLDRVSAEFPQAGGLGLMAQEAVARAKDTLAVDPGEGIELTARKKKR